MASFGAKNPYFCKVKEEPDGKLPVYDGKTPLYSTFRFRMSFL